MNILLEIGMEEIPARFLKKSLLNIEEFVKKELEGQRIGFGKIKTFGTPRRLILQIDELSEKQEDLKQSAVGPAKNVAYDIHGELTKAGIGFAKSQGIDVTEIKIIKTDKGEYIASEKFIEGVMVEQILPDLLKRSILSLTFPKSMRWGDKKMRFARPIRWILALKDSSLIPLQIENIKSGIISYGHRFFGEKCFEVENIDDYYKKMRDNYVIVDIEERKKMIIDMVNEKCTKKDEKVLINPELLDEVVNLIEYPYPVMCTFNPEFLEVPQEVLIITMETHQRYFPVLDENGKMLPKFVVIRNGIENSENVKKGNEKVVSARLADARFFYYEDLKKSFESNVEKLKNAVFQKDLGTIYEKVERNIVLANKISDYLNLSEDLKKSISRTVYLSKADLVTNMIGEKEYTKLQGFMGMVYAQKSGEDENVSKGIFEHYLPRFQNDILPETYEGAISAITDKIDTITGCFGVGLIPSGSADPYALRRAALGIINIILKMGFEISITKIIDESISIYSEKRIFTSNPIQVKSDVIEFFKNRIINVLVEKGHRKDIVEAAVNSDFENINDVENRIKILESFINNSEFEEIVLLTKRLKNISKDFIEINIDKSKFSLTEEKELFNFYLELTEKSKVSLVEKNYNQFFQDILAGKVFINNFFDKVMVMDKDEAIKNNRLSLIKSLNNIFNSVAIISMINE